MNPKSLCRAIVKQDNGYIGGGYISTQTNYCVYCHVNKTNGKRYVGITCRTPEERWQNGTRYTHNEHFYRAIQKYGWDGFDHIILHRGLNKDDACKLEVKYIRDWKLRDDKFGYNMTDGGEGCPGRVLSEETKAKISKSHIGIAVPIPNKDEWRRKISKSLTGKPHPRKGGKRHPLSDELKQKLSDAHKIPVAMFDKEGLLVHTFKSAAEGATFVGLKTCGDISKCCRGRRKIAGGYSWRYIDD